MKEKQVLASSVLVISVIKSLHYKETNRTVLLSLLTQKVVGNQIRRI